MTQLLQIDVVHGAPECPVHDRKQLETVIANLEGLVDRIEKLSDGKMEVERDWYFRNSHTFRYLVRLDGLGPIQAEDILKEAIGLQHVTVRSFPTESGEQALDALHQKLAKLSQ